MTAFDRAILRLIEGDSLNGHERAYVVRRLAGKTDIGILRELGWSRRHLDEVAESIAGKMKVDENSQDTVSVEVLEEFAAVSRNTVK